MERRGLKPSPALVLASIALLLTLTGAAVAGPQLVGRAITKAKVKAISKKQANAQITRRAPGLAVASAGSAQTAQTADSANPVAFAHVAADGTVDAANSKGVTQANVINTGPIFGYYCFGNLPFVPRGGNATIDFNGGSGEETVAQIGLGNTAPAGLCPPGTQLFVDTRNTNATGSVPTAFFLTLYR